MRTGCYIIIFSIVTLTGYDTSAQTYGIEKLRKQIATVKTEQATIDLLNELSYEFYMAYLTDSTFKYGELALEKSRKLHYLKGEGFAQLYIGCAWAEIQQQEKADSLYQLVAPIAKNLNEKKLTGLLYHAKGGKAWYQANFQDALKYYDSAHYYYNQVKDEKAIALVMRLYSLVNYDLCIYAESIRYSLASFNFFRDIKDTVRMGEALMTCGEIMKEQHNYPDALSYYRKSLSLFEALMNRPGGTTQYARYCWALIPAKMGDMYVFQKDTQSALRSYSQSTQRFETARLSGWYASGITENYAGLGNTYELIGDMLLAEGKTKTANNNYRKAKFYYEKSIEFGRQFQMDSYIIWADIFMTALCLKTGDVPLARASLDEAYALAGKIQYKLGLRDCYLHYSKLYEATGNPGLAYLSYKKYIVYRDSINNEETIRKTEGYGIQDEMEKKEHYIRLLAEENRAKVLLLSKQRQQKNFALLGISLLVAAGAYAFYYAKKRRKLRHQQALMNERLRISQELHDEVGATLSGIAMYSHLTREQLKNGSPLEVEKSLDIIQQSSGDMVNKLNDIVWLINPGQDSLGKLIQRLEEYARDMAAIKHMQVKINLPPDLPEQALPMENRRSIYLFCKEAINNAVKYSNGTLLQLTITQTANRLEFSVSDNGKGFDAVMIRRGNGLENMQQRADQVGAKLLIESKSNEGARVSMQFKI